MSYQHILVPVDGSKISLSAVHHAATIAKAFHAKLTLISVIIENPFQGTDFYSSPIMKEYFVQAQENAQKALNEASAIAAQFYVKASTTIIQGDVSSETLSQAATNLQTDLIVMGSHGRKGFQKFLLGNFAQDVLKSTTLPVLLIKE